MASKCDILIVDDDRANLDTLERLFAKDGYGVIRAQRGNEGLDIARSQDVPIVLTDLMMPGEMDGLDLLKGVRAIGLDCDVILMTAYGTVEVAVEAMKEGAYDFITKPFKRVQVLKTVERAWEKRKLLNENKRLRDQLQRNSPLSDIIGSAAAMKRPLEILRQAAPSKATLLISGESGTGKELFARAAHRLSEREGGPFVAVNCAALPESILESELFGYEKGAFTGAASRRAGRFETADGGTLFLDEISDMSLTLQAKLLRVIQEGEFERLGSSRTLKVDVRIVAATNRNLRRLVEEKKFREDLFYRLNVINVRLPPLRERMADIPLLAQYFLTHYAAKNQRNLEGFQRTAMENLLAHPWPGNVRELEKTVERAVILCRGEWIDSGDLFEDTEVHDSTRQPYVVPFGSTLSEIEKQIIFETLSRFGGDKKVAAQVLGIAARTIYRKLEQVHESSEKGKA